MDKAKIIKISIAAFGVAIAIFSIIQVALILLGININPEGSLNNTRLLFSGCFLVSIPLTIKFLK
jgi:hypothetical protein